MDEQEKTFVHAPAGCDFCYIMPDDSMIVSRIYKGDLLCFRAADAVEFGKIAAVVIDGSTYVRKVYQLEEGEEIVLCAYGDKGPLVANGLYNAADVQIVGVLVESHHYFD